MIKTYVDFLTAVSATTTDPEIKAYAEAAITKHDTSADSRRVKAADKAWTAAADLLGSISSMVDHAEPLTSATAAAAVGISTQKASAVLKAGVAHGVLVEMDPVKGKSGKVKAFCFATDLAEDPTEDPTEDFRGGFFVPKKEHMSRFNALKREAPTLFSLPSTALKR